jgi:TonB family protein
MRSTKLHEISRKTRNEGLVQSRELWLTMKLILTALAIIVLSSFAMAQSGRRVKEIKTPMPPPLEAGIESKPKVPSPIETTSVMVPTYLDYRCVSDGGVERMVDPEDVERIGTSAETDARAEMTSKPRPVYTKEARRLRIQGFVHLRVLLSADGKISRVRVMKGLRAGLTENAIRAACRIEFKPAMKTGQPVAQWVTAEYVFRLADSSIFAP